MSAIFWPVPDPENPVRLVNVQTLGALCGRFPTHEDAEEHLRRQGYDQADFWREGNHVCFLGGMNC